ncbi:hypothetical protein [Streptomyces sp. TN58]|uniref:hypothetical protein n=1 Tax=Streptomyces sp. TN58 TaxID=234612 RepID=UPI0009508F87|nr:hypothetical protein [Streptomyces sp. TN58]APU43438.1 hypothetical protein BSL84_30455 [Streptomyces sp. TN58]
MSPRRSRLLPSWPLVAWWATLTAVLWLAGMAVGQPASIPGCAASAALLAAVGEVGDRARRRWKQRRTSTSARLGRGPDS